MYREHTRNNPPAKILSAFRHASVIHASTAVAAVCDTRHGRPCAAATPVDGADHTESCVEDPRCTLSLFPCGVHPLSAGLLRPVHHQDVESLQGYDSPNEQAESRPVAVTCSTAVRQGRHCLLVLAVCNTRREESGRGAYDARRRHHRRHRRLERCWHLRLWNGQCLTR